MKACIIQPPYSRDVSFSDEYFQFKLDMLDRCDESIDLIVLPEYSDVPCATVTREETLLYHHKYIGTLLDKCREMGVTVHLGIQFLGSGKKTVERLPAFR